MKGLLFIVVLSLLAVGYARDQEAELAIRGGKKGDHTKRGSEGYSHGEILMVKCSEMARNTTNTFSLITNSNVSFTLLAISISWEEAKLSPIFTSSYSRTRQRFDFSSCLVPGRSLSPPRLAFLAWGDFHVRSRFARSTIPEEKWGLLVVYC